MSLSILKDADADAVSISHAIDALLPGLSQSVGENTSFITVFSQAPSIEESISDLATEGALGLAFAVLIILVFLLSLRSTIITAISIPLSLLVAMIGLWVGDFSLNIFTLAALTVAVGRVVDDSIVVIENIKRRDTGAELTPDAIVASVKEVAGAVTASTLTTVAVFVPLALVGGISGELLRPFAITVGIALGASLLVSLTIVPVLAYWFLRSAKRSKVATDPDAHAEDRVTRLQRGYLPVLGFAIRRPLIIVLSAVVIFVGTMASATLLKTDFIGSFADRTSLQVDMELPVGTKLAATSAATAEGREGAQLSPRSQQLSGHGRRRRASPRSVGPARTWPRSSSAWPTRSATTCWSRSCRAPSTRIRPWGRSPSARVAVSPAPPTTSRSRSPHPTTGRSARPPPRCSRRWRPSTD